MTTYLTPLTCATATGAAGAAVTLTISATGAGTYLYIKRIEILRSGGSTDETGNAALVITTTNLPGSLAWTVGNGLTAGATQADVICNFNGDYALKSSTANTNTTIVCPDPGTYPIWRINVYYFVGT